MVVVWAGSAGAQNYLPLTLEVSNDRPLLVFQAHPAGNDEAGAYVQRIAETWSALPEPLKPYSILRIDAAAPDAAARHARYQGILSGVQSLDIPVVIVIGTDDPRTLQPIESIERLLFDYPCVKGVWVADISFNDYYAFGGGDAFGAPPQVRWLLAAIDAAAKNGRFTMLRLGAHAWPHALANTWSRSFFETLRASSAYVFPITGLDGDDTLAQQGMMMGLWLQNAAAHWGVECSPEWYSAARFIEPGVYGTPPADVAMPAHFYRTMILNGAMAGATVYAFDEPRDLWTGDRALSWESAIAPTLREIIDLGLIPRKELVAKKALVAYQMDAANTPLEMQVNLRDIDGVYGEGLLIRGAYGMERAGQTPELVPNTGAHYWVPILSPFGGTDGFARVVDPNTQNSASEWTQLLDQYLVPDGTGPAFVTQIGRSAFILHTRENHYEEQAFVLPQAPSPVRDFTATRQDTNVTVSWPFREGDVTYRVYKRAHPGGALVLVADQLEQRDWTDNGVDPQQSWSYAVTALTNEREPYEGTVNYGDAIALSMVHSRIEEEAVITPLVTAARSMSITTTVARPTAQDWWPNLQAVADEFKPAATEIVARIEQLDVAFTGENLASVMELYAPSYEDSQGWRADYVKRAYQWFFERYNHCTMARQIRQWDFSNLATRGQVRVLVYCRFAGTAISDASGRVASMHATFPSSESGEVWFTMLKIEEVWRIEHSEPAVPNFRDILRFSTGPYDALTPGPDTAQ
ncbi:MAG: hypothetical protein SGI88_03965 [Candidatus Hydrogenedentes bacterium]|nr:hypothetical protein [Candidatus Hydrogenedentota bacterium]